eukprot:3685219-Prymnesium_polylepis.1
METRSTATTWSVVAKPSTRLAVSGSSSSSAVKSLNALIRMQPMKSSTWMSCAALANALSSWR